MLCILNTLGQSNVNVDYAYGSVETFEYQNNMPLYSNGVPEPYADTVKP